MHRWHSRDARPAGAPAPPRPHQRLVLLLAGLAAGDATSARSAGRRGSSRLLTQPRRVAPVIPPTVHLGIHLLEREWREEVLPAFMATTAGSWRMSRLRRRRAARDRGRTARCRRPLLRLDHRGRGRGLQGGVSAGPLLPSAPGAGIGGSHLDLLVGLRDRTAARARRRVARLVLPHRRRTALRVAARTGDLRPAAAARAARSGRDVQRSPGHATIEAVRGTAAAGPALGPGPRGADARVHARLAGLPTRAGQALEQAHGAGPSATAGRHLLPPSRRAQRRPRGPAGRGTGSAVEARRADVQTAARLTPPPMPASFHGSCDAFST